MTPIGSRLRRLAVCGALALPLLGALGGAQPTLAAPRATPLAGSWSGAHALRVTGSLEGGFSVVAGESWLIVGCPVTAGQILTTYSPKGGSSYSAQYLWIESETTQGQDGVRCTNSYRGPETVTVVLSGSNSLSITGCGYAFCGTISRAGPAPPATTTKPPPTTTRPPATTTKPPPTTTRPPATTAAADTEPPVVAALPARAKPGAKIRLVYHASDNSGKTRDVVAVYLGSTIIAGPRTSELGPSVAGKPYWVTWTAPKTPPAGGGHLRFCVQAQDAAGNKSATDCAAITVAFADTSPPQVWAFSKGRTNPGSRDTLRFRVEDDSGRATVHATLFQDGAQQDAATIGPLASGSHPWNVLFAGDYVGPLYFCVWAEDAAGNRSVRWPKSNCAWITLVVPIEKVSNGCGGGLQKWDVGVIAQNYFGNEHTFHDFGTGHKYTVNFAPACDVHDAGYGGNTVRDSVRGGIRDFHSWTRKQVDDKFLADLRKLCNVAIPATAADALANCVEGAAYYALPVNHLIGAETLYGFVHKFGDAFFDSDLTRPGLQRAAEKKTARDSFAGG